MNKRLFYTVLAVGLLTACAEHDALTGLTDDNRQPINICSSYPTAGTPTRVVIDGGFVAGDEMGVFVVDYNADGQAGEVLTQGNRASNMKFTLQEDGSWTAPAQLYWAQNTPADFYGYFPFDASLASVDEYSFTVAQQQGDETASLQTAGYTASDLLWAKTEKVEPTMETVYLQYKHLMAGITIRLEMGTGFTADEWTALKKTVLISSTILTGTVDLTSGSVKVGDGTPKAITALSHNGEWRAVVLPQTVAAGKPLVSVTVDGQSYSLTKKNAMEYVTGKMHLFTITVNKRMASGDFEFELSEEAITAWLDDSELHEGLVRQYAVVEVQEPGTLKEVLANHNIDWLQVENLKVTGHIDQSDLQLMSQMPKIANLNLQKALIADSVFSGFYESKIQHLVMPETGIKRIAGNTLQGASSLRGSLVIPEGVEEIGWGFCLDAKSMTVAPQLPSTLRRCDGGFFEYSDAAGDFRLPDGIEIWEGGLANTTGEMYLPSSLKKLGWMPGKLTGTINIPQGCVISDNTFENSQCTAVVLPEGLTDIPGYCFRGSQLSGELVLPSTLEHLGGHAFLGTKITKVIFPDALIAMDDGAYGDDGPFSDTRLMGTLELPKNVARIPKGCFYNCQGITALVIPEGTLLLDENCFARCSNISSIVCQSEEPPLVCNGAFLGVSKDNFTVEVPQGCVEKYKNAQGWRDFKRISEYSNFVCRPAQAQALNSTHSEKIILNADEAWTVKSMPTWCTLSATSGKGKTDLTLAFSPLARGAGNRQGEIVFQMTQDGKTIETKCSVVQYDYQYDEDGCLALQTHTKGNNGGIDIVFVGDGYDGASIADGSYLDLVKYQTECFFAIEPYKSMRDYFNVYVTFPLSQEKGVNTMYTYVNNRFGTLFGLSSVLGLGEASITSNQLITESDDVMDYVVDKTPVTTENVCRTLIILVPNSTEYEGSTQYLDNGTVLSICPPSEQPYPRDTRGTIQHEAGGHGFGHLGDEVIGTGCKAYAPTCVKQGIEEMHNQGWFANLATTGKLSSVPWAEFIFDPDYSDYVDVFEGGFGFKRGIYRPEANSCMNYGIPYYNTPSRLSIYRRILEYAGENFTMEKFRAQDTFEWGEAARTRSARMPETAYVTGNHQMPVIVKYREIGEKVRAIRAKLRKNKK